MDYERTDVPGLYPIQPEHRFEANRAALRQGVDMSHNHPEPALVYPRRSRARGAAFFVPWKIVSMLTIWCPMLR